MKPVRKSIGSLAAVAALAPTQQAAAATIYSTFSNVPAVGFIDIDGNGVDDFFLNSSGGLESIVIGNGTADDGLSGPTIFLPEASTVNSSFAFEELSDISPVIGQGPTYLGVRFDRAGQTHHGFLAFDVPTTFITGTLIGGGWESNAFDGAAVVTVPEPTVVTFVGGGLALLGCGRRRRERS